jgi:hypothetical protein
MKEGNNYEKYIDDPMTVEIPRTVLCIKCSNKRKREEVEKEVEKKPKKYQAGNICHIDIYFVVNYYFKFKG